MSRLRLFSNEPSSEEQKLESNPSVQSHHILIEAVPVPVGTNEYDPESVRKQSQLLQAFRKQAKDTFEPNDCRCVTNAGQRLYQTQETYGISMSAEQMIEAMEEADLTLRVNFRRPGVHSATTCMELSPASLSKALEQKPDGKNLKTLELRVKAETNVAVPRHGAMFISLTKSGAVHLLSHIDYKIMSSYDEMYHSN